MLLSLHSTSTQLEDPGTLELFGMLPALASLYLTGNPLVSHTRHYRNTLITTLPGLQYLDDRPVFDVDRAAAEAWYHQWPLMTVPQQMSTPRKCGGLEAERAVRARWTANQHAQQQADAAFMIRLRTSSSVEVWSAHVETLYVVWQHSGGCCWV